MALSSTRSYRERTVGGPRVAAALNAVLKQLKCPSSDVYLYVAYQRTNEVKEKVDNPTLKDIEDVPELRNWYIAAESPRGAQNQFEIVFTSHPLDTQLQIAVADEDTMRAAFATFETEVPLSQKPRYRTPRSVTTRWEQVDRALSKANHTVRGARDQEDSQAVGLLCREALISLAQAVFDADRHRPPDGVQPSSTDAGRMVDAYFGAELKGASNENARRHARAALALAVELQHKRTAGPRDASLCLEATSAVVNILSILARG